MAIDGRHKNQVVWQDIRPAKPAPKRSSKLKRLILRPLQMLSRRLSIGYLTFALICLLASLAIAISIAGRALTTKFVTTNLTADANNITPKLVKGTPSYSTILPSGKTIADYGGWTRISPSDRNPVFAYVDKLGATSINISEQPLPDDFRKDTETQVAALAHNFQADEKITVGTTIVHIGSSAQGPQSIIFSKSNLLVMIKSNSRIDNNQWAEYINSLQ